MSNIGYVLFFGNRDENQVHIPAEQRRISISTSGEILVNKVFLILHVRMRSG